MTTATLTTRKSPSRLGRPPSCECGICEKCVRRLYMREWYNRKSKQERQEWVARRDKEKVRQRDRERYHTNSSRRTYIDARTQAVVKAHPEVKKAHDAVSNALRDGRLQKQLCEEKNADCFGVVTAHHDDYSAPLDVRWLCRHHHAKWHVENGSAIEREEA